MMYMVLSKVAGQDYLSRVEAHSAYIAEHMILDKGTRGRHAYGVDDAQAFDEKAMKTDFFINATLHAIQISKNSLFEIIERHNENIREKDVIEESILNNEKLLAELKAKVADLEQEIAEDKKKSTNITTCRAGG